MPEIQVIDQAHTGIDIFLALLDWPFLLFIFITIFIFLFKDKIVGLLERNDIQISWGENQHIKLKDLSDGLDKEFDPIREEIQVLREQIDKLFPQKNGGTKDDSTDRGLDDNQREVAESKILDSLKNQKYRWRSVEHLATATGVSESDVLYVISHNPDIVLSTGKSKRQIAKLKDR